jgi:hypothetical protein
MFTISDDATVTGNLIVGGEVRGRTNMTGSTPTTSAGSAAASSAAFVVVRGRYAYVLNFGTSILAIFDVSDPTSPVSIGTVTVGLGPRVLHVRGRYAYVTTGVSDTLQVVDISNRSAPAVVGSVAITDPNGVYVHGRYAYVANVNGSSMHVVDIATPTAPAIVGTVSITGNPRGVFAHGRYVYIANYTGAFNVVDISTPSAPLLVGTLSLTAGPVSVYVQGRYAYVAVDSSAASANFYVISIDTPSAPTIVSSLTGIGTLKSVIVRGRYAYLANGATGGVVIVDVSTPASLTIAGTVNVGGSAQGIAIQGRYAYLANTTSSALQTFDLSGSYMQQLETGDIETGSVLSRGSVAGIDADFEGALTVGQSVNVSGPIAASNLGTASALASDTDTTFAANSDSRIATQKATKAYVDAIAQGLAWKAPVIAATTAAGTLASSFANGSVVDGVTLATGNRILIKNQASGSENGVYTANASGAPTRATDADTGAELVSAAVFVQSGTANADKAFVCTNDSITLGSTAITFTAFASVVGALIASNNLSDLASASTARTNLGLGTLATQNGTYKSVGARAYNTADQTISNATVTSITFDSERWDNDTIHDTSTNTGRLTCKTAGTYTIAGQVSFDFSAVGARQARIKLNGATIIGAASMGSSDASDYVRFCVTTVYQLAVNDYVELEVYQSSGGNLKVIAEAAKSPEFMMHRLGD